MRTKIQNRRFENRISFTIALSLMFILLIADVAVSQVDSASANYWIHSNNQPSDTFHDVIMINNTSTYILGNNGNIYHSTNVTNSFNTVYSASQALHTIDGNSTFLAVAGETGFFATSVDGNIWDVKETGSTETIRDIEIQGNNLWLVGDNGLILYSNNYGSSFVVQTSPKNENFRSIDFFNKTQGWIVGDNGIILTTINQGQTWFAINSGTNLNLNSINLELSSSRRMWIGGDEGLFMVSLGATFGQSFTTIETNTKNNIYDVYSPIFGIVWAVGENSTILGLRGNEFKNTQVIGDNLINIDLQAVFAIGNLAITVGDDIFFNKVGLVPAFISTENWQDWVFFATEVEPLLIRGMFDALRVIVVAIVIGFFIGLIMATFRTVRNRFLNIFATLYSDLFRNTPLLVQLFVITYGLPELGINPPLFVDAVLGLCLNTGAYQSEIIRSGILAIPRGQMEAARSLGMTNVQAMRQIILPQAVRLTIPPLSNEAVILFLNSSLLSVIAYQEITRVGQIVANSTFLYMRTFLFVALTYFIVTYSITRALRRVEKKLKIPGLGGGAI